jgi:hypothetical protein
MNTDQRQEDVPKVQEAIYDIALSLDAFLLNGIPYGVLQNAVLSGFLEKTTDSLLRDLANLEKRGTDAPADKRAEIAATLRALRATCQRLIDLVTELTGFQSMTPQQLRSAVAQIPLLREDCVQKIQELEMHFATPKKFYLSRSHHSTSSLNAFLSNLEQLFEAEYTVSRAEARRSRN